MMQSNEKGNARKSKSQKVDSSSGFFFNPDGDKIYEDIREHYSIGQVLGSGSFGQVRVCTLLENGERRAVKLLDQSQPDSVPMFCQEIKLLLKVHSEHIIQFYEYFIDHHFLYIVMELCTGGELLKKVIEMRRFCEEDAARVCRQVVLAIAALHSAGICHRDIKAENLLLDGSGDVKTCIVKLIDFGLATSVHSTGRLSELCGSAHYLAPELLGQNYSFPVDLWSLGVLMYLLLYGYYPYDGPSSREIMMQILRNRIQWTHRKEKVIFLPQTSYKLSPECLKFLKGLLCRTEIDRLTAEEALEDSWLVEPADANVESAHRRVTESRMKVAPAIEEKRNSFLRMMDEDYREGLSRCQRLNPTAVEEISGRPEFVRRDNKVMTAPSRTWWFSKFSMRSSSREMQGGQRLSDLIPSGVPGRTDRRIRRRSSEADLEEGDKAKLRVRLRAQQAGVITSETLLCHLRQSPITLNAMDLTGPPANLRLERGSRNS
ncbi:calmodulin-domain protein kinase, putative [Perkinsus marinus ATCC 50983]|uniref:Calmodulin-domain protein kinase, putative n=1 Tax=Perkinsus marinus (strain ATCC 50983 / TXsc) TaxID=423536 RepID=C5LBC8_PERM5|nr:calmodulin-domain protein kinase, putative [Perkinsus marinus ATCC 50983]EER06056.1 calmodulin-domain protein kinase, putative [Perkinsus marinus ATCC 50983]|eukprot:XP_002774240.1 calmodulin-domain protein kinase, putative [Perkinsus marinus ATCC 50983]